MSGGVFSMNVRGAPSCFKENRCEFNENLYLFNENRGEFKENGKEFNKNRSEFNKSKYSVKIRELYAFPAEKRKTVQGQKHNEAFLAGERPRIAKGI